MSIRPIRTSTRWPTISPRVPVPVDGDPRRLTLLAEMRADRRLQWRAWALIAGGVVLILLGLVALSAALHVPARLQADGVVVAVTDPIETSGGSEPVGRLGTIEYRVAGRDYRCDKTNRTGDPLVLGGRVPVYYLPDDPGDAVLDRYAGAPTLAELLLVAGVGCAVFGGWRLARESRRRRSWDRVALDGLAVQATVIEVEPAAGSWWVTAEAGSGVSQHRFRRYWFDSDGTAPEPGQRLTFFVDPEEPGRHLFAGLG